MLNFWEKTIGWDVWERFIVVILQYNTTFQDLPNSQPSHLYLSWQSKSVAVNLSLRNCPWQNWFRPILGQNKLNNLCMMQKHSCLLYIFFSLTNPEAEGAASIKLAKPN